MSLKNTFRFFVSKAKPHVRKGAAQFTKPHPKQRSFKAKYDFRGDARGIAVASTGIGVGAVGVGEGVRRGRRKNGK